MTTVSHVPRDDRRKYDGNSNAPDDMSDVTPPTRGNGIAKEQGMVSKVLKFRFKVTSANGSNPVSPSLIHTHWIDAIQDTFGSDVVIINNKNQKIERIELLHWSNNPLQHQKHFKIHQKTTGRDANKKTTAYLLHRIYTNESITTIKSAPKIQKILKDHDCYITEHQWDETEWDTVTIGFVTSLDPSFYSPSQAHIKFHQMLHKRKSEINEARTKIKIPSFKMIFTSPATYSGQNTRISTKAYSIEVRTSEQTQMMQVLKSLLSDNLSTFVPYTMRYKYPESFEKAIKYQTLQITNNRTIVLQNISESAMYYMETHIKAIKGVKDLLPANNVEYTGRHNLLADKNEFNQIRNQLFKSLVEWYDNHVPSDALPKEGKFTGPPRVKPIMRDSESSGENSWASRSSASFMSMDLSMVQNDDYFSTKQSATTAFTYAAAVTTTITTKQARTKSMHDNEESKDVISDITGVLTESATQKYKIEIEQLMAQQKQERVEAEAIMSAQKAEIQRLTEAYRRANQAYEEATTELRTQRDQVNELIMEKLSIADKKRNEDMEAMRHEMMLAMKEMLQKTQHNSLANDSQINSNSKRLQQEGQKATDENDNNALRREKRVNRRQTPTKKLIFDEEHLPEELMTQYDSRLAMQRDDASSISE